MNKLIIKINNNRDKITYYIAIILCSILPFVIYPKYSQNAGMIDLFMYYKSILIYFLGVLSLIVLLIQLFDDNNINRINKYLSLFMAWAVISTCFSTQQITSVFGLHLEHLGLLSFLCFYIFYTLISNNFKHKFLKSYINIVLISSSIMSLLCLTQFFNIGIINYIFSETYNFPTVVYATFGNSNFVGSYFSLIFPLSVMMLLNAEEEKYTIILLCCTVINCMGLLISASRISLISALVACFYCIYFTDERSRNYGKLASIIFTSFIFLYMMNISKGETLINGFKDAVSQTKQADVRDFGSHRIYIYENIIRLIYESKRNALVGVGLDCLVYHYSSSEEESKKYPELAHASASKAHSDLIEYAATMGIPSLIFYVCFVLSLLLPWFKKIKTASPEKICIFAGWLGYLIQSMFNAPSIGVVVMFFVFSAILDE